MNKERKNNIIQFPLHRRKIDNTKQEELDPTLDPQSGLYWQAVPSENHNIIATELNPILGADTGITSLEIDGRAASLSEDGELIFNNTPIWDDDHNET